MSAKPIQFCNSYPWFCGPYPITCWKNKQFLVWALMFCPPASCACASDSSALLQACFALKCWLTLNAGQQWRRFLLQNIYICIKRIKSLHSQDSKDCLWRKLCVTIYRHICTPHIHINIKLWFVNLHVAMFCLSYAYWFFIHVNISLHSTPVLRTSPARDPSKSLLLHSVAAPRETRAFRPL